MKEKTRRLLSTCMAIVMLLSILPVPALAEDEAQTGGAPPEVQTIELPVVAGDDAEAASMGLPEGGISPLALAANDETAVYTYVGESSVYINRRVDIDTDAEPAANGILRLVDAQGQAVEGPASDAITNYYQNGETSTYYLSYETVYNMSAVPAGTYTLQLIAGNETYACTGVKVVVVGADSLLVKRASISNLYAGLTPEVELALYGLKDEAELADLSLTLKDSAGATVATSTGLYRAFNQIYDSSGWWIYAQLELEAGQSIAANTDYSLTIAYSGDKTLVDGVGTATGWASTPTPSVTGFAFTDAQTGAARVTLANWDATKTYRVVVRDGFSSDTVYASWTGEVPESGVVELSLTLNGVTVPASSYPQRIYVDLYEVLEGVEYRRSGASFENAYHNLASGACYFQPSFIKPTATSVAFTIDYWSVSYVLGEGDKLSMRDGDGVEVGSCTEMTCTRDGTSGRLTGTLSIKGTLSDMTTYYLYLNGVQFDTVRVTSGLGTRSTAPMMDYTSGGYTFWTNLGVFPVMVDVINSSGTGELIFRQDGVDVLSSGLLTGGTSEYDGFLRFEHHFTAEELAAPTGGPYTLVFHDSEGREMYIHGASDLTYVSEVTPIDFSDSGSFYALTYLAKAGESVLPARIYFGSSDGPKNVTVDAMDAALKALSLSNGADSIAVTGYTGAWNDGWYSYELSLELEKPLTAGDYTLYHGGTAIRTFTVAESGTEDTRPRVSRCEPEGGCIYGANLPTDSAYTGELYQGYTCLTETAFTLTLSGDGSGDTSQYLYFPQAVLSGRASGDYEIRVYQDGALLGSVSFTLQSAADQPIVSIMYIDERGHLMDGPALLTTTAYISVENTGAYSYIRFAETAEALAAESFEAYFTNRAYIYEFTGADGPRTLYVELSKTGTAEDTENLTYPISLWLCADGDFDVQVPEDVQGVKNPANDLYTITATAELPATNLWISFYDAAGGHASKQMTYVGQTDDGRYGFSMELNLETFQYGYEYVSNNAAFLDHNYTNPDDGSSYFYFKDTRSIRVFATDLSNRYVSNESYTGNVVGAAVERVLMFGELTGIVLPQFANGAVLTNQTGYTVYGYATPGSAVAVSAGGTELGTADANAYGYFTCALTGLTEGTHTLTVADATGISTSVTLKVDLTAPAITDVGFTFLADGAAVLRWVCKDTDVDYFEVYRNSTRLGRANTNSTGSYSYNVTARADDGNSFTIYAYDEAGNRGAVTVTTADTVPPEAPEAAPAASSVTTTGLTLTWGAGTDNMGVAGYDVYKDGDLLAKTTGTDALSYAVTGLEQGTAYSFTVKTRDTAGLLSADSPALTVSTVGLALTAADLAESYIMDAYANKCIPVSLSVAANAPDYAVALSGAYVEYRAVSDGADAAWISGGTLNCTDHTASGGWDISGSGEDGYLPTGSYELRFTATDSEGGVVSSDPVHVVLLKRDDEPPSKPGTPTAVSHSTTTITFGWTASEDNVAVDRYEVWRGETKVAEPTTNSYTDTGLEQAKSYTYTVVAVDRRGNRSAVSDAATLSTVELKFDSVTTFDASYVMEEQTNKRIAVAAKFQPEAGYAPDVTMALEYKLAEAESWSSVALTQSGTDKNSFSGYWSLAGDDSGYLPAGSYSLRFAVTDGAATAYSEVQTVQLKRDDVKPVVTSLSPASGTYGGKEVQIIATATDNVGVKRIVFSHAPYGSESFTVFHTMEREDGMYISGGSFTWDASALASGDHTLRAVAYDLRDNASEPMDKIITIDNTPPAVPGDFAVTGTSRYIHVMWSYDELPTDFKEFRVYRSTSADGEFDLLASGNSLGYFDDGESAEAGTTYYYYVTAVDDYGNESAGTAVLSATLTADTESPTIGDMRPAENAALRHSATLRVTAADNYRLAKAVFEYRLKGTEQWTEIATVETAEPTNNTVFSCTWDISALAAGAYEIRASVYDDSINDVAAGYVANAPAVMTRTVTVRAYTAPVAPEVSVTAGYKRAALSWSYAGSLDTLDSFYVYSCDAAGESLVYQGAAKAGASGSYTADIPVEGTQYFVVAARDDYGATAYSSVVSVSSLTGETEAPVAVIMPETLTAVAGTAFTFSGAMSTDNDAIASYAWDFGDGSAGSGRSAAHTYDAAGTYAVTLTVTDLCGNIGTATKTMTVYDVTGAEATHAVVTLSVVNGYAEGTPGIAGAEIKIFNSDFETTVTTGADGSATVVVPIGALTVSAAAEGFVAATREMKVAPDADGSFAWTLAMTPINVSTVGGSLSYTEMTYDEILAAGIDVTDPDNQHVWKFAATLRFVAGPVPPFELPVTAYYNEAGQFIQGSGWGWISGLGGGGGGGWSGMNLGLFPISENFILVIYGEAHWLKEMYNVELLVINNSYADDITGCVATLELPEGLSLAAMNGAAQTAAIDLGTIAKKTSEEGGANTGRAMWYVRGDKEGEYTLTASVTGSNPTPFYKTFTTDKPLKVYAGTALKLFITAEDIAYRGEEYHVQFKLQNVSDKELYNLSFGITGAEQFKVFGFGDYTAELPLTHEDFGDSMTQSIDVLEPGGYIAIDFTTTTWFNSIAELTGFGPFDVGYYLTDVFVTTLEGSTTTIPYQVEITHVPHGSFFEWLWDQAKGLAEGEIVDVLDDSFFGGVGLVKNGLKVYRFLSTDTTDAASRAEITIVGGRFTSANNFLRGRSVDAVTVYTDATEENYTISADGSTMTITGPANIYVQGEADGEATMQVTTYTQNMDTGEFEPNTYTVAYTVNGEAGNAARVVLQAPEPSTVAVPLAGQTAQLSFPYALLDENGGFLGDAANATWTIAGEDTTGLRVDKGVVTVDSTAKGGDYTLRLALSEDVYAEQGFTLTREASVATAVQLYRGDTALTGTDTLVVPVGEGEETHTYTARLFDQYGVEMEAAFTWTTTDNTSGAAVVDGRVTLTRDTALGTLTLTATAQGQSASVTVTVTNLAVDWSGVETALAATTYTYGDKNGKAALPASGTATAVDTVNGVFTYADGEAVQGAGARQITVVFTVTDEGKYAGSAISRAFAVTIGKKPLAESMIAVTGSYTYTGEPITPSYTVTDGALLTDADYTAEVTNNVNAGGGLITVTAAPDGNYSGSASRAFAIAKADITGFQTVAPAHGVYAYDPANTGTGALKAIANGGAALPETVTVAFGDGLTAELPIVWADSADTFRAQGGSYTYRGTVTAGTNFNAYAPTLDAVVTVSPVYGFITQSLADRYVPYTTARSAENFGLYAAVDLTYNAAEDGSGDTLSPGEAFTTGVAVTWSPAVSALEMTVGSEQLFTISSGLPDWATVADRDRLVIVTDKFPVDVTVTAPGDITYGETLGDPAPTQTERDGNGVAAEPEWRYLYEGTTVAGAAYSSAEKPTQAGSYTVTATLVSDTHAGSGTSGVFAIRPKALADDMLEITGSYTYTGEPIIPSYTVADGALLTDNDYTAEVTNNVNAGSGATVTITGRNNYQGEISKNFSIMPASIAEARPRIIGEGAVGQTLTGVLDVAGFAAKDFTWQWRRDGSDVGADSPIYTLTAADSGCEITLAVSAKPDTNHTGSSLASEPVPVAKMDVSGTLTVSETNGGGTTGVIDIGDRLTVSLGGVTPAEARAGGSLQWYRGGTAVEGAQAESYTVTAADADAVLRVVYTPPERFSGTVEAAVEVGKTVLAGTLTVSGTPAVGETLAASFQTTAAGGYDLVWLRDGAAIAGASGESYVVVKADQGRTITAKAVAKGAYTGEVLSGNGLYIPAAAPDAPVLRAQAGDASVTLSWAAPADNGASITGYTLYVDGVPAASIAAGATSHTVTGLTNGRTYRFVLRAANAAGYSESAPVEATPAAPVPTPGPGPAPGPVVVEDEDPPLTDWENPFADVAEGDYFYDAVGWAVRNEITTGTAEDSFSPAQDCTRAQIVTFLWRAYGSPEPAATENPFTDVDAEAYYYKAVLWAVEQGITTGATDASFAPDAGCTRAQAVTFLWRAAGSPEASGEAGFADVDGDAYYAAAVRWALAAGVTDGVGEGLFAPDARCTRGQIVTMLYRAMAE